MRTPRRTLRGRAAVAILGLVAAACASGASASQGAPTMRIAAPADGAAVSVPFTVRVDASVPLGAPSTGDHHVHLCFDGASCDTEYSLVYGNTFVVRDLPPGEHTIEASLRNADHSDAGVSDTITVTVGGGSGSASTSGASGATGGRGGYGY